MTRYFNSGLYEDAFYTKHQIDLYNDCGVYENIEYDRQLLAEYYLAEYYKDDMVFSYSADNDKWEQEIDELFWDALSHWTIYFEPLVFDKETALKCGLTPFTYKGKNLLALSGCGMDLSPRLDAYQALSHKTIDRNSRLFFTANRSDKYFEYVVGKELAEEVLKAIA